MGRLTPFLWPKVLAALYFEEQSMSVVYALSEGKQGHAEPIRRTFALTDEALSGKARDFLDEIRETYPKCYFAVMPSTLIQGATDSCDRSVLSALDVDVAQMQRHCVDGRWQVYLSRVEMRLFIKRLGGIEPDFVFSPFVVLKMLAEPSIGEHLCAFVLHEKGTLTLGIWSKERLWYAKRLAISENFEEESEEEDLGFSFDLDDMEADTETVSGIDTLEDFEGEAGSSDDEASQNDLALLEYDLDVYEALKETIEHYYHDDRYPHEFVSAMRIYDVGGLGEDIVRFIEDELFIDTVYEPCNVPDLLIRLSSAELS